MILTWGLIPFWDNDHGNRCPQFILMLLTHMNAYHKLSNKWAIKSIIVLKNWQKMKSHGIPKVTRLLLHQKIFWATLYLTISTLDQKSSIPKTAKEPRREVPHKAKPRKAIKWVDPCKPPRAFSIHSVAEWSSFGPSKCECWSCHQIWEYRILWLLSSLILCSDATC